MSAKSMHELKEKLCDLLEEVTRNGDIKLGDLEAIDHLTASIKNLKRIDEMEENGYSYGMGDWNASGNYSNRGYSNDGNGMGYSNGNYSNRGSYGEDDTMSGRRMHYVRGHYSRGDMIADRIEEMMEDNRLSVDDKSILKRAMDIMRK